VRTRDPGAVRRFNHTRSDDPGTYRRKDQPRDAMGPDTRRPGGGAGVGTPDGRCDEKSFA